MSDRIKAGVVIVNLIEFASLDAGSPGFFARRKGILVDIGRRGIEPVSLRTACHMILEIRI